MTTLNREAMGIEDSSETESDEPTQPEPEPTEPTEPKPQESPDK